VRSVQEIFPIYANALPDNWKWATIYFVFGEGQTGLLTEYGFTEDRSHIEKGFKNLDIDVSHLFHELRNEIAPTPMEQPTHIELTIEPDGKFNTVLGYGEPNWDPAPRPWPDDITAKEYTYTKAWPDGMSEEARSIMEDPRSLIGYD